MIGPMLGRFKSGYFGFSAVFISTSALLIVSGLILFAAAQRHPELVKHPV
jgi:MFS transporter, DHA1 family, multidrug resistance protein